VGIVSPLGWLRAGLNRQAGKIIPVLLVIRILIFGKSRDQDEADEEPDSSRACSDSRWRTAMPKGDFSPNYGRYSALTFGVANETLGRARSPNLIVGGRALKSRGRKRRLFAGPAG
jgi:hypothetical protein